MSAAPAAAASAGVRGVVFDLGGVLLRLDDPLALFELEVTESEFHALWLRSQSVREFERGAIDARSFAESVVRELALPMSPARFRERFDAWPQGLFPETPALLEAIPAGIQRVLLSNTNAAHWGRPDISGALAGQFDLAFLSYRTGILKPDRAAFAQVAGACRCAPGELLFFDDNPGNITAARDFGMRAHLVKGPADARAVLDAVLRSSDRGAG